MKTELQSRPIKAGFIYQLHLMLKKYNSNISTNQYRPCPKPSSSDTTRITLNYKN